MNRTKAVRIGVVVAVVALGVGIGVWATRPGPDVVFLGDSITAVSGDQIKSALGADYTLHITAVLGIKSAQMLPAAKKAATTNPDQVVIDLGSNDVLHGTPLDKAKADLGQLIAQFPGARCIHVVNINTHMTDAGKPLGQHAGLINSAISHLPTIDPRIDIIDWNKTISADVAAHPPAGTLTADTVHPTPEGSTLLTRQIRTALDHCTRPKP